MLYHRYVYLPRSIEEEVKEYNAMRLEISHHAYEAANSDVYGEFALPLKLDLWNPMF